MLLSARQLLHLPVFTRNGMHLGRICGFEFEVDTQTILRYEVRRSPWFGRSFPVHRNQVVLIGADRMTVEDLVVPEHRASKSVFQKPTIENQPAPLSSLSERGEI